MDALDALLNRVSCQRLIDPSPQGAEREQIFAAALRAPDHGHLRPWRFLVVEGDARHQLGAALVAALRAARPQTDTQVLEKLAAAPQRAPLVIVLVVRPVEHPKVPRIEQMLSLACAVQNMQLAAYALGFGRIWRTGDVTYVDTLATQLGLEAGDRVAGFLYLGTPQVSPREPVALDPTQFFAHWQAAGH